jgi:acetyl-CoA carboxylase, biotin carboxyl carrier protein
MSDKKTKNLLDMLADVLDERDLSEIELEDKEMRVRVARERNIVATHAAPAPQAAAPVTTDQTSPKAAAPASENTVNSPIVGTVYLAPEPGAANFVSIGDQVSVGQTLLIVEAMKVMNPITATRAGKVTGIHVTDSQPVEFGAPLLDIE